VTPTDAELALAAAEAGAAIVRAKYGTSLTRFEKSATDFATEADVAAERAIKAVFRAERPGDGFVGEESGSDVPERAERTWLVDPLCGTVNYAAQTPLAAVNVALLAGGRLTAAVCADPLAGEAFWTDGQHAFLRRNGQDHPLQPSAGSDLVELNVDPPYPHGAVFRAASLLGTDAFAARLRPRVLSTSLALPWVAAGRRAAYVTDGNMSGNVHFGSGIAVCLAAGCTVTGLRGEPWQEQDAGLIAAADRQTHSILLELIGQQFARRG
jgi:myo-inositol-1(or 4)-monophosphatase